MVTLCRQEGKNAESEAVKAAYAAPVRAPSLHPRGHSFVTLPLLVQAKVVQIVPAVDAYLHLLPFLASCSG